MTTDAIVGNIISGIVGGLAVALAGHFLTKDRESERDKKEAKKAADTAKSYRIDAFFGVVSEIHARISISSNPREWVGVFKTEDGPTLLSEFNKLSPYLEKDEADRINGFVSILVDFAKANPEDVELFQSTICDSLGSLMKA